MCLAYWTVHRHVLLLLDLGGNVVRFMKWVWSRESFMKWRGKRICMYFCDLWACPCMCRAKCIKYVTPEYRKVPNELFQFFWEVNHKIQGWKRFVWRKPQCKTKATVCQPSSQPNTRHFTALSSKDRRLELLNWGMKQQSTIADFTDRRTRPKDLDWKGLLCQAS